MVKKFRRYLYSFWRNSGTWRTDRRTDGHRVTAIAALCIASHGKNRQNVNSVCYTEQADGLKNHVTVFKNILTFSWLGLCFFNLLMTLPYTAEIALGPSLVPGGVQGHTRPPTILHRLRLTHGAIQICFDWLTDSWHVHPGRHHVNTTIVPLCDLLVPRTRVSRQPNRAFTAAGREAWSK